MRDSWTWGAVAAAVMLAGLGCGGGDDDKKTDSPGQPSALMCTADQQVACMCPDGRQLKTCTTRGRPDACPCFGNSDPTKVQAMPTKPGTGGTTGSGGATGEAGTAGTAGMMMSGAGGMTPPAGSGGTPAMTGSGGMTAGSGGGPAMTGSGGTGGGMPTGTAEVEALRQVCVDTINMYRASVNVTPMLMPLVRGTPADETCSDDGAKIDGDSGQAHKSAGMCMGYGGQDACPGWPVGGNTQFGGFATLEAALKMCLQQMWDEGEPPVSRAECQKDYEGCFLKYGHYLNMSDPSYTGVVCGFYLMMDGKSWWMNQDFKSKPWGAP